MALGASAHTPRPRSGAPARHTLQEPLDISASTARTRPDRARGCRSRAPTSPCSRGSCRSGRPSPLLVLEPRFRGNEKITWCVFRCSTSEETLSHWPLGHRPAAPAGSGGPREIERGHDADPRSQKLNQSTAPARPGDRTRWPTLSLVDQQFQERRFLLRGLGRKELLVGLLPELDVVVGNEGSWLVCPRTGLGVVVDKAEPKSNVICEVDPRRKSAFFVPLPPPPGPILFHECCDKFLLMNGSIKANHNILEKKRLLCYQ